MALSYEIFSLTILFLRMKHLATYDARVLIFSSENLAGMYLWK